MKRTNNRSGFSLMELLAVMAIMAMLTTLAVTSYFSAVKGLARRRAMGNFYAVLVQARQRACIDSAKTRVVCYNVWTRSDADKSSTDARYESTIPTYVVCKSIGRVTAIKNGLLCDEFTPLDRMFSIKGNTFSGAGTLRIYNLTRGGWSDVEMGVQEVTIPLESAYRLEESCDVRAYGFKQRTSNPKGWVPGDAYGIAVSPEYTLPKNIYFGAALNPASSSALSEGEHLSVMFYSDGRAESKRFELVEAESKTIANLQVNGDGNITATAVNN